MHLQSYHPSTIREGRDTVSELVRMKVCWRVTPQESGRITAALHSLMMETRTEPSCVSCKLSTEMGERTGLCYVEEWKSERALMDHLRSSRFSHLAELLERATERPSVEFQLASGVRGIDYAEEVRARGSR